MFTYKVVHLLDQSEDASDKSLCTWNISPPMTCVHLRSFLLSWTKAVEGICQFPSCYLAALGLV